MLETRAKARADRDFATADAIRDQLSDAGIVVEDSPDGARWYTSPRSARDTDAVD
jgi:cysteinyl-tRNA synthetase